MANYTINTSALLLTAAVLYAVLLPVYWYTVLVSYDTRPSTRQELRWTLDRINRPPTDPDLPGLDRTDQWVGIYVDHAYRTDHDVETYMLPGTDHTIRPHLRVRVQGAYKLRHTHDAMTTRHPVDHYDLYVLYTAETCTDYSDPVDWQSGNLYRWCRSMKVICTAVLIVLIVVISSVRRVQIIA